MKKTLAVIAACIAGGYAGFCIGFIVLSVDAAWKGILQPGYEWQWGIFAGIFYACIAGAVGGVIGISRFRIYLGWPGVGVLLLLLCWIVRDSWIYWPPSGFPWHYFAGRAVGLTILIDVALGGAMGVAMAKHVTNAPRIQFNLNTLLVVVTMVSLACGLFGIRRQLHRQWLKQELAADRQDQWRILERLQHFQCSPEWGKPPHDKGRVAGLHLIAIPPLQDHELQQELAHLDELVWSGLHQTLDLRGPQVSDRGLVHLSGLSGLQQLDLRDTEVTDSGIELLSKCNSRSRRT